MGTKTIKILFFGLLALMTSCSVLDQAGEMKTFTRCEFRVSDVEDVILAGIDLKEVNSMSDLSFAEATNLSMSVLSGKLPLGFILNVEVRNPNEEKASMNEMYWDLLVDDIEITRGKVSKKVSIPPGGTATMPVPVQVDLLEALSGESSEALMNFGMNLSGTGNSMSRVKLRIKPSIYIGMTRIKYPGFFIIEQEFYSP